MILIVFLKASLISLTVTIDTMYLDIAISAVKARNCFVLNLCLVDKLLMGNTHFSLANWFFIFHLSVDLLSLELETSLSL